MAFDYKKDEKEIYRPGKKPVTIELAPINYVAIRGFGDPNEEDGDYKRALEKLYALEYTIKMSKMNEDETIENYFDYVVPPLEGLWFSENGSLDLENKDSFNWISMIRLPEFVTEEVFEWAKKKIKEKKGFDPSDMEYFNYDEGLCVQCMHIGPYDEEAQTIEKLKKYIESQNLIQDINSERFHHEIYLSDPRRAKAENLKTVIRLPVRKISN